MAGVRATSMLMEMSLCRERLVLQKSGDCVTRHQGLEGRKQGGALLCTEARMLLSWCKRGGSECGDQGKEVGAWADGRRRASLFSGQEPVKSFVHLGHRGNIGGASIWSTGGRVLVAEARDTQ